MIGVCLAAGAGTRLEPLTRVTPKPLLAPAGRPLVDLAVEALRRAGATRVVVNAHHGADQLVARLAGRPGVEVVAEPVMLGTGGGLVNAARLGLLGDGDDPVLVTAADHVVDPADLADLAAFLDRSGAPMAAGLIPAGPDPFGLRLEETAADPPGCHPPPGKGPGPAAGAGEGPAPAGGRVVRDPAGPWDSAGAYALRAGLLCDLEPGPATQSGRVLGPQLDRGRNRRAAGRRRSRRFHERPRRRGLRPLRRTARRNRDRAPARSADRGGRARRRDPAPARRRPLGAHGPAGDHEHRALEPHRRSRAALRARELNLRTSDRHNRLLGWG